MTKKADDILAKAKHFYQSGGVVNVRTKQGDKYRGYVDKVEATFICINHFAKVNRRGVLQRVTLLPENIISINVSKAFN
jgi:hypothetical protein